MPSACMATPNENVLTTEPSDGTTVIPGDTLNIRVENLNKKQQIKLGPGLCHEGKSKVMVCKSGTLRHKQPDMYWVDCHQKRYVPSKGENVIGVVTGKLGDLHKVDIGSSDQAILHYLSFEGSSKRNRPNISNGDVIFAKVTVANKDMEPEISCIDPANHKANGMGVLSGEGFVFAISLNLGRKLLSPDCVLLPEMGARQSFEIVVGLNGKIALFCKSIRHCIAIMNVIQAAEFLTNVEIMNVLSNTFG